MSAVENDRLFITQDIRDSDTEVFWRAADRGIGWPDDHMSHGSILISNTTGDAWVQTAVGGEPVTIHLSGSGARFYHTDDYTDPDPSAEVKLNLPVQV